MFNAITTNPPDGTTNRQAQHNLFELTNNPPEGVYLQRQGQGALYNTVLVRVNNVLIDSIIIPLLLRIIYKL